MVKTLDLLICFKVKAKKLKLFELKLKEQKIDYSRELNDNWYNYRFNEKNIEIIKYYIIYFNLNIENENYFITDFLRLHKNLTIAQRNGHIIMERTRFGK